MRDSINATVHVGESVNVNVGIAQPGTHGGSSTFTDLGAVRKVDARHSGLCGEGNDLPLLAVGIRRKALLAGQIDDGGALRSRVGQ